MNKFELKYTKQFNKDLLKLTNKEQQLVYEKIKILQENPFYKSLRTKKYYGLEHVYEMSVNMNIRILWKYEEGTIILLLDIGHHNIL